LTIYGIVFLLPKHRYYDDANCTSLLFYTATANGRCVSYQGQSVQVDYPNVNIYQENGACEGTPTFSRLQYIEECSNRLFAVYGEDAILSSGVSSLTDDGALPSFAYRSSALLNIPSTSSSSSSSLSTGAVIGIAVGAGVVGLALVAFIYFFVVGKAVSLSGASSSASQNPLADEEN
jgi:hypothetical protein